jgi:hypothetical protein
MSGFKNKRIGTSAEYRYMYKNWVGRFSGNRSYSSMGIFDMIFIDKGYNIRLVQLKYSSRVGIRPTISKDEINRISMWIDEFKIRGVKHIWAGYVLMYKGGKTEEYRLNL